MTPRLQRWHRRIFGALALVLAVLVPSALRVRATPPVQEILPAALGADEGAGADAPADPLLYWSRTASGPGAALPADARLLGVLRRGSLSPELAPEGAGPGHLLLYSLAHQEVVERLAVAAPGGSR